ncbi:solute carrier family 13 member 2-like [Hoplias malabaricus]|uniref:solute carrier family 13 member 2-like n=1 Tax=Hoplias malabaricus TaxID=27720 RepID=UPI0034623C74
MGSFGRQLWNYRNFLVAFLTPLLLLPLPLVVSTSEAKCGFVVLLMALYWCTECVPLAVTSLLPVVLFPIMGIMKSEQVCQNYMGEASIMGAGGLIVAIAFEHWNLHKRLALGILLLVGARPALLMMGFMIVSAFLSMWVSSVGSTAMMLPIVHSILEHLRKSEAEAEAEEKQMSRVSQDLHLTQTKHSTEETRTVFSAVEEEPNPEELCHTEAEQLKQEQKYVNLRKGMSLCVCYAASIGGTATLTGSFPNLILKGQIDKLFPENGGVINYTSWFLFSFPHMVLMLFLSWLFMQFMYLGFNVKQTFGCRKASTSERLVYKAMKIEYRKLGRMSFPEWCVLVLFILLVLLWFTREPGFSTGWGSLLFNKDRKFVTDSTVSVVIGVLFFIIPSRMHFSCYKFGSLNISGRRKWKAPPALIQWNLVQSKMPWNIVLLLGGSFALAKGTEVSKLSIWIGQTLEPLKNVPHVALSFVICIVVAMLTEICNNAVIGTVVLPVLASMASAVKLHPLYIMLPSTISSSLAFMLPVGTAPNALTYSYANLKIIDMAKPGCVLNLLGILCINFALHTWGIGMFQLNELPPWLNITTTPTPNTTMFP